MGLVVYHVHVHILAQQLEFVDPLARAPDVWNVQMVLPCAISILDPTDHYCQHRGAEEGLPPDVHASHHHKQPSLPHLCIPLYQRSECNTVSHGRC